MKLDEYYKIYTILYRLVPSLNRTLKSKQERTEIQIWNRSTSFRAPIDQSNQVQPIPQKYWYYFLHSSGVSRCLLF